MINTPFTVGEIVNLREAFFQVTRYEPGRLRLREIPAEEAMKIIRAQFEKMAPPLPLPVPTEPPPPTP